MSSTYSQQSLRSILISVAPAVLVIALVLLVGRPAINGYWARDDLTQLAYVRLLGSPWPLFANDHFPVPGSIFRPLGFASLWVSEQLFGTVYSRNVIADLVLHGVVALALYQVMRAAVARTTALVCCLVFALTPVVVATVLSWSNRFDLLAVLFTLVALRAALDWARRERWRDAVIGLAALLAALLSKESGAIALVLIVLVLIEAALSRAIHWRRAVLALAAVAATGLVYVIWRRLILGASGNAITGDASIIETLTRGTAIWWKQLPGYLGAGLQIPLLCLVLIAVVAVLIVVGSRRVNVDSARQSRGLTLAALAIVVLPGILQAPIAVLTSSPVTAVMSPVELGMQARLYYTASCGFAILLALGIEQARSRRSRFAIPALAALTALVSIATVSSYRLAAAHAERSYVIAAQAREVVGYIATYELPTTHCRVVILGYQPPPEWDIVTPLDSVIKALAPNFDQVSTCLFANEHHTYIHLFAHGKVTPTDWLPWKPLRVGENLIPPMIVGGLEVAYLEAPTELSRQDESEIRFLRITADGVVDVSSAVRDGTVEVRLQ